MRVVVTGATGNVGISVLEVLAGEPAVEEIVGLARRPADLGLPKVDLRPVDVRTGDLEEAFTGAGAVVHLAWAIQPSRRPEELVSTNVTGTGRVLEAVARAGVPALVYASSVGAYSAGPKEPVDESWPAGGVPASFYSRQKAEVEAMLDRFESSHPGVRVVRLRKGLVLKASAGAEIRRYFFGRLFPRQILQPRFVPALPRHRRIVFQVVHALDAAEAYRLAVLGDARGAFNVAADPVLTMADVADLLGARAVSVAAMVLRAGAAATWRLRLQPTPPGWVDLVLDAPVMETDRARRELGWEPRHGAREALAEMIEGVRQGMGMDTPPLRPGGGPLVRATPRSLPHGGAERLNESARGNRA